MLSVLFYVAPIVVGEYAHDEVGMLAMNTAVELDTDGGINLNGASFDDEFQESGEDYRDAVGNTEMDDERLPDHLMAFAQSYFPDDKEGDAPLHIVPGLELFDFKKTDVTIMSTRSGIKQDDLHMDLEEANDAISTSFGFEAGFMGFSGSVEASTTKIMKTEDKTVRADVRRGVEYQIVSSGVDIFFPSEVFSRLKPKYQEIMKTADPRIISSKMGAFYAEQITYGALFKSTVMRRKKYQETEDSWAFDVSLGFENAVATAKASAGGSSNKSFVSSTKETRSLSHVLGGDPDLFIQGDDMQPWFESVNEGNMQPVSYVLKPLYELLIAVDAEKGKALREHQWKIWNDRFKKLLDMDRVEVNPPPLSRCYSSGTRNWWQYDNSGGTFPYKMGLRVDFVPSQRCNSIMHYPLGDVAHHDIGSKVPAGGVLLLAGDVKPATGAEEIWHDNDGWHRGKVWKLQCPMNYGSVGHVWTKHGSAIVDWAKYRCIPQRCIVPKKPGKTILFQNYHWVYPPAHRGVRVWHHPGANMHWYFNAQLGWDNDEPLPFNDIDPRCFQAEHD